MASIQSASDSVSSGTLTRRALFGGVAGAIVGTALNPRLEAAAIGPLGGQQRRQRAFDIRVEAAQLAYDVPQPAHPCNGDEELYPNRIGNYSKGLLHNSVGEVDANAYSALLRALASGVPEDFENIPLGCFDPARQRKLINPQAGLAFDLEGTDSHQFAIPPAPALASAWAAGEAVEFYVCRWRWQGSRCCQLKSRQMRQPA